MARHAGDARATGVSEVAPASDTASVVARVRAARAARTSLRIVGGGTWLDAGRPVRADALLSLAALRGVTEYEPGDFTLTARAGTTLAEIAEIVGHEGQWLPLEPYGSPEGTIGATIATASWGPLASAYGTPRDNLLGCEVVTGVGDVVRAGGRVVKNVAGFDLVRLMTGAWGTLGVITEVTVRLRARPQLDRTLAVVLEDDDDRAGDDAARWLRSTPYRPLAVELCSPTLAERVGLERRTLLLVRIGGNEALVRAAERAVGELGAVRSVDPSVWARLRTAEPRSALVLRLGTLPASLGPLWARAARATSAVGGWSHATVARGIVRCVLPAVPEENERVRGMVKELHAPGSRVVERAPEGFWPEVGSSVADTLSRDVRRTFDPDRVLNPGILEPIA
ncbi:MAG TPA: FAD-binding protein [Gemmatimonadaceae bacterium]|nr:FAD-binding protein [Gemmatimonadaceae bacterium]